MKIGGLQKVSTIDYPGEIACVVFLWGCNFRCGFCHNPDLVLREVDYEISGDEFFDFLSRRMGKLDAVVISGGEPLISLEKDFVRRIKSMGFRVKIDTNGSLPEKLREFVDEGLVDYVAMDVKGCKEDYTRVVNVEVDLGRIEESMRIVEEVGGEFRTTVVSGLHDLDSVKKMGEWMNEVLGRKPGRIFLQGFKANKEGMIDDSFLEKGNFLEGDLRKISEGVVDLFGEVDVRI